MKIISLFFLIFYFNYLQGQNDTLIFSPVNNTFLQQCDIRSIIIGNDGKLWLSTNKGIAGYDGNNVQIYSEHGIFGAFGDQKDNLYLIENPGIYYFDTKTGKEEFLDITVDPERSFSDPRTYTTIFVDSDGSIWCGRTNGFLHYNNLTNKTTFYGTNSTANKTQIAVRHIQPDIRNSNILWLGTDDGIYRFDKKSQYLQRKFNCSNIKDSSGSDVMVSKIHVTADAIWFVGGKRGVGYYDIKTGEYTTYPYKKKTSNNITEINLIYLQAKSPDEYYVGSADNCPGIFNIHTHQYTFNSKIYKELPALRIDDVIADRTGNLWCIMYGQLYYASANKTKFSTIPLKAFSYQNQLKKVFKTAIWNPQRKCYYLAFDNTNDIIILDSNLEVQKSIPIKTTKPQSENDKANVYDITLDNKDRLWACGSFLTVYDSLTQAMVPTEYLYKKLLFHHQRFQNIIRRDNYLYLQPSSPIYKALYRINLESFHYDSIPIPYQVIPVGYENSWKGRSSQEVAVIDKQGKYAYIGIDNYILQVNLLTKEGKKITRVTIRDNGYYFNMFWYALDDIGNLWVTSSEGVSVINPNNLKIFKKIHHDSHTNRFQIYNIEGRGIMCLLYSGGVLLYDYKNNKEYNLSLSDGLITLFNSSIACVNNVLFVGAQLDALQFIPLNSIINTNKERRCYVSNIQLFNTPYVTDTLPEYLNSLILPYDKNFLTFTFSSTEFEQPEQLEYRYKLDGVDKDWVNTNYLNRTISYPDLKPGNYIFHTSIKNKDGSWNDNKLNLLINIIPAWWQTNLFKITASLLAICLAFLLTQWRINAIRKHEKQKSKIEKNILELEAKALRAQMNPHFIFNCMNSIKSLIQKNEQDKAVNYLTTFSKLIRTIFQNSDTREITLYDEIETCRLYAQLESMRFSNKFSYEFNIDKTLDLKSIMVPALVVQPFIENAIWHGIMPKEDGGTVKVTVEKMNGVTRCVVEDDGIGREVSNQNKFKSDHSNHESKGVHLTQVRLDLYNVLNERNASVETIDKKDEDERVTGTSVILTFREY